MKLMKMNPVSSCKYEKVDMQRGKNTGKDSAVDGRNEHTLQMSIHDNEMQGEKIENRIR